MSKRVEIEKKFYCEEFEQLKESLLKNGFNLVDTNEEKDEYFTDLMGEFIQNRTCLRIRTTNNEQMELTFKGKSKKLSNVYAKTENNISVPIVEYEGLKGVLLSLGYYSYSIVSKKRSTYSCQKNGLTYNIMIDQIKNVGNFVEFEILSYDDYADIKKLKEELNQMIDKFSQINFSVADLPYRDFVAYKIYNDILPQSELKGIFFDLDGTLIHSEQAFYQSFSQVLFDKYNIEITFDDYKKYELEQNASLLSYLQDQNKLSEKIDIDNFMEDVYQIYEQKFKVLITNAEAVVNFELIKMLKEKGLKIGLISTSKNRFIQYLIQTLHLEGLFDITIGREDVSQLKPASDAYLRGLSELNLDKNEILAIEDSKRGIMASTSAGIKTIQVNQIDDNMEVVKIDSITRLLLILNTYL